MSKKIEVTCAQCGVAFSVKPYQVKENNFCCRAHFYAWRRNHAIAGKESPFFQGEEVKCSHCGKPLIRRPGLLKKHKHHFCNQDCLKAEKQNISLNGESHPNWKGGSAVVKCSWCGEEIIRAACETKKYSNFFCCREHQGLWLATNNTGKNHPNWVDRVIVECSWCGIEIERQQSEIGRYQNFFCCRKHQGLYYAPYQSKEGNPNWRGGYSNNYGPNWEEQRAHARQRDRYQCRMCGLSQDALPRELDVHHIVAFREFRYVPGKNDHYLRANRLSNLVSLCPECHGQANFMAPADLHLRLIAL